LEKAPDAFRTISEVADEIDVPQHVLRFWESRFTQIRPMKRGGGRRYYRPDDVDLLRGVRHLLYGEGYTIRGVQRILREQGAPFVQNVWRAGAEPPPPQLEDDRVGQENGQESANEYGDEGGEEGRAARPEPNLFEFAPAAANAAPRQRREPMIAAAPSVASPAAVEPAARLADAENQRKLQAALDELVACRRLLDAALQGS
jgi:DNA-binding transcriptional MerR regulator